MKWIIELNLLSEQLNPLQKEFIKLYIPSGAIEMARESLQNQSKIQSLMDWFSFDSDFLRDLARPGSGEEFFALCQTARKNALRIMDDLDTEQKKFGHIRRSAAQHRIPSLQEAEENRAGLFCGRGGRPARGVEAHRHGVAQLRKRGSGLRRDPPVHVVQITQERLHPDPGGRRRQAHGIGLKK